MAYFKDQAPKKPSRQEEKLNQASARYPTKWTRISLSFQDRAKPAHK
ncbi:conserved hypothetical protein [delta proteobacterium NaphS2]|nr:conserved hypothetical protein [delta proteobacterium NaphS2]